MVLSHMSNVRWRQTSLYCIITDREHFDHPKKRSIQPQVREPREPLAC